LKIKSKQYKKKNQKPYYSKSIKSLKSVIESKQSKTGWRQPTIASTRIVLFFSLFFNHLPTLNLQAFIMVSWCAPHRPVMQAGMKGQFI
jgi:hypothetical protein